MSRNFDPIKEHYNKFNEDKRLSRRHGMVEFATTMHYIHEVIESFGDGAKLSIADIGAGTGGYAIPLHNEGHRLTCVEYVKYNLGRLRQNCPEIEAYEGDARRLRRLEDDSYDITLLLGPMYHLFGDEDKISALSEAKRITKKGGYIIVAYLMNEYAVITHGFKQQNILSAIKAGKIDEEFHTRNTIDDLYDYVRLEDIDRLRVAVGLEREKIVAADGAADYMRRELSALSDEEFDLFIKYHLANCERYELLGASAHTLDILRV